MYHNLTFICLKLTNLKSSLHNLTLTCLTSPNLNIMQHNLNLLALHSSSMNILYSQVWNTQQTKQNFYYPTQLITNWKFLTYIMNFQITNKIKENKETETKQKALNNCIKSCADQVVQHSFIAAFHTVYTHCTGYGEIKQGD